MDCQRIKVEVIGFATVKRKREIYFSRLRGFLNDLSCNYPYFKDWLEGVFMESVTQRRTILVCEISERIVGVAILKDTPVEKKICTLRVDKHYKRQGIGSMLIKRSMEILNDPYPLITVSDEHIEEFRYFLYRFGFKETSKIKSVYHYGMNEYYFNKAYQHENALLSIQSEFAHLIFDGKKTVEFRKVCFDEHIRCVYVYSTSPDKMILGYFIVDKVEELPPKELWLKYGKRGCVSEDFFFKYFKDKKKGYAICISKVVVLRHSIVPEDIFGRKYVPQNFMYIDNVVSLRRLRLLE